ncbi:hypothetical protein BH09BAC1_BH09BAC1_13280 [soil metagenome]
MEIKAYTAAELVVLTQTRQYAQLEHLPVSKLRALSHLQNPRLNADTPMMYIAWQNEEVVGYRMVLCDHIYVDNETKPVGWYSCVWVDPNVRGQGIAKNLVIRCLQDWEGRIFGADAVPESRSLYLSTGLYAGELYLEGARAYLKLNLADTLIKKKPALLPIRPLLKVADGLLGMIVPKTNSLLPKGIKQITEVDDEVDTFIKPYLQKLLFRRDKDDLNWITHYPWMRSGEPDHESRRYYFSSVAKRFEFKQWVLRNETGRITGYIMLSIRDGHLKTPYVFVEDTALQTLGKAIAAFMVNERLEMLTTFHPGLAKYFKEHRKPFIFVKSVRREYFVSLPVSRYVQMGAEPNICDGDGDQAFT